jgi:alpha-tubulin suppressor-like RCC1 family protein
MYVNTYARVRPYALLCFAWWACSSDTTGPGGGGAPPSPFNVSNSRASAAASSAVLASPRTPADAGNVATRSTSNGSRTVVIAHDDGNVAYVSLDPQTYPTGENATIRNTQSGASVDAPMVDGGLDPVPLRAAAGDNVEITIHAAGGATVASLTTVVPAKRTPKVVRTIPGRGKTGVPLNKNIQVVFTEPVDPASLSLSSVQLLQGGAQVAGSVGILQGVTASIVFKPSSQLQPNTGYELVITPGVRDLDGDALDSTVRVPFTTGTTIEGHVVSLEIIPDAADVSVGDQFQLSVVARDANGSILTGLPIIWSSDYPDVATVSATGLVTARTNGVAIILAEVDNWFNAIPVEVSSELHAVASVTLAVDSVSVTPTGTFDLAAIARDADGNLLEWRIVQWSSSNVAAATVTQATPGSTVPPGTTGPLANVPPLAMYRAVVTGVAAGVSRVIATIGGKSDTAVVSVGASFAVTGFDLSFDTATVLLHANTGLWGRSINAAGRRDSLPPGAIQWESSNSSIASIDGAGSVTGNSAGSATITARWLDYSATATITVAQIAIRTVSPGQSHTCALTTDDAAYCWGGNYFGQIGRPGLATGFRTLAQQFFSTVPLRAAQEFKFASISVGGFYTCALTAAGAAYCWGYNGEGSLGSGNYENSWRPVVVTGGRTFAEIVAGTDHTCARTTDGVAYCWGLNRAGDLGNTAVTRTATPMPVSGSIVFASLTVGGSHTCGLTADGDAYCWGDNAAGQLGVGENVANSASPLAVSGGRSFSSLSAGEAHTCGVTRAGSLYCWGWNLENQLGSGNASILSAVPVPVESSLLFISVAAGRWHTCAIDASGAAWCWGQNTNGQIGTGTPGTDLFATPQRVSGGFVFDRLSAGRGISCAGTNGEWRCWGSNLNGMLGIGSVIDSGSPVKILGQP